MTVVNHLHWKERNKKTKRLLVLSGLWGVIILGLICKFFGDSVHAAATNHTTVFVTTTISLCALIFWCVHFKPTPTIVAIAGAAWAVLLIPFTNFVDDQIYVDKAGFPLVPPATAIRCHTNSAHTKAIAKILIDRRGNRLRIEWPAEMSKKNEIQEGYEQTKAGSYLESPEYKSPVDAEAFTFSTIHGGKQVDYGYAYRRRVLTIKVVSSPQKSPPTPDWMLTNCDIGLNPEPFVY